MYLSVVRPKVRLLLSVSTQGDPARAAGLAEHALEPAEALAHNLEYDNTNNVIIHVHIIYESLT